MVLLRAMAMLALLLLASLSPAAGQGRPGRQPPARPPADPTILDLLEEMTPEQRQAALEKIPPERRKRIEARLERYERLSPEERQQLRERYERFRALPAERQQATRLLFERFRQLPPGRRPMVRQAVRRLQALDPEARRRRMNRPGFRARFSPEERGIIADFLRLEP